MQVFSMDSIQKWIGFEYNAAIKKYPEWTTDPIHAVAILVEECGELVQAVNDFYYDNGSIKNVIKEAAQVGAMVIRFMYHVLNYKRR